MKKPDIDLSGLLRWVFVGVVLVCLSVQVVILRMQVADLQQAKPMFYTVTDRGKELLMVQIK